MRSFDDLAGVIPAVATPLSADDRPNLPILKRHLWSLEQEGCSGVLLMGTTGEGPSLGLQERVDLLREARSAAGKMKIIAGTGCASLEDTKYLTRQAFDLGADAVLVVPPFYFKNVGEEGLLAYYQRLLDEAIPSDGALLLYHIPQVSQIPIPFGLLRGLLARDSRRVAGVKDSSGDLIHLQQLCQEWPDLRVFTGSDDHLLSALQCGGAGCITAAANAFAPLAVAVYHAFIEGDDADRLQDKLTQVRDTLDDYRPFAASIKHLLARRYGPEGWFVRPPLTPIASDKGQEMVARLSALDLSQWIDWM
jgi:4-hydroxy-tetrahydrodipicolinate synthase